MPTGLVLENISETEINVLWNNGSQLPDGVRIYISIDGINFIVKGEVTNGYESFIANELTYGITYYFYIVGYKGSDESDPSVTLSLRSQSKGEVVIRDGNTLAWWDSQDVATITKNAGTGEVSAWASKIGASIFSAIGGAGKLPIWSVNGVLFDGIDDYLRSITIINQPATYYLVFKQVTWTLNDTIFDGHDSTHRQRVNQNDLTPRLNMYAGAAVGGNANLPLDTLGIVKFVFNGADSYSRVLRHPIVGPANVGAMDSAYYFHLGSSYGGGSPSNIQVLELIIRGIVDADDNDTELYNYLQAKYNLTSSLFDNGKFIITTDDFSANVYTVVHPLLMAQGVKATHYVYGRSIDSGGRWAQVQAVLADGMDIQCHTYTHARLSDLTPEETAKELNDNTAAFVANGIPAPQHIAYPLGSPGNVATVDDLRVTGRTIEAGFIYKDTAKYFLKAKGFDGITESGIATLKANLDVAQASKYAYMIYLHGLDMSGTATSAQLNDVIDYAQAIGMDIITVSELHALMD
jgi:peptidoglycan/xylan/chitin deacetylase (PgdA/CDA1 family)